MQILIGKNYDEMSDITVKCLMSSFFSNTEKRKNISITTGKTPMRTYEKLVPLIKDIKLDNIHFYNFDEIGIKGHEEGITINALNAMFFDKASIESNHVHALNLHNWEGYEKVLEKAGGIDLILLGIGKDGHFCGNLSGTVEHFGEEVKKVSCRTNPTIKKRMIELCGSEDLVEEYYVTFGCKTVMNAKEIIVFASGLDKADIIKEIIEGNVSTYMPASILKLHPNITYIFDAQAASKLTL